jgi:hypothetical protein
MAPKMPTTGWLPWQPPAPDLLDKPLAAAYFYRRYKSAVLFAHTLLADLAVIWVTAARLPRLWVYAAAFLGHALLDRIWMYPATFYWPWRGWRFHVWGKRGSEQDEIGKAYWVAFTRRPELWGWEVGGLLALVICSSCAGACIVGTICADFS